MKWPFPSQVQREALLREQMVALLPRLRRFARNLAGDRERADDLLQAACERALRRLDQYRDATRFDSWLYRIIYTQWIDRTRRHKRQLAGKENLREIGAMHGEGQAAAPPVASLLDAKAALEHLSDESRAAIVMVAVEGYTYAEAAEVLEVPAGTVASRVARARRSLVAHFKADRSETFKVQARVGRRL
jgi:RNA polymerase sigma-70 factor (ECF subfamily)